MSQGMQITIPDFDDDDLGSATTPFSRSGFGFGGGFGRGFGGPDSPSASASLAERSYFSHTRGDSSASVDSTNSARYASKPSTPFAHSSQSSIATTSTGFSKKPSFASIRNAFKSGKNTEVPPVPPIEYQPYPVLKNPFNRSTSSLHHVTPTSARPANGFTNGGTSPFPRPPTPSSTETRFPRGTPSSSKSKGHAYAKSQHSHSGSIFHTSDGGSDYGTSFPSSPPPVPRVPTAFGQVRYDDTPPISDFEDDKVIIDPKTPSDFALHAVFIRFATTAEGKIDTFIRQPLDHDPLLPLAIGPGVDRNFDETLQSLGKIAQKHSKAVIDSIMRWRRSQHDSVGSEIIRLHITQSPGSSRTHRTFDIPGLLNERKSLASIYIMCRALIAVLQTISRDALGDAMGYSLEETTFEQFRRPDLKLLAQSANHRTNAELYATLLGHIANIRFISVTDRFLGELNPVALGQVPKDLDMKYENLVRGLKHIQIKVWPPEAFEEGAEFMESLSKSFAHAHGQRLKIAFVETLSHLLHPIGKTAQAETNNPQWGKAIEIIFPKAKEMMAKPRYWQVAFPLAITSLCVAPQSYFLKHWVPFFEAALSKLKEKPYRVVVMNGMLRLIWTYMYRCQESASTTTSKLENLLKHFFPPSKLSIVPADEQVEPFIYIVHFILSRHPDFGKDLCLELMQEAAISSLQKTGNFGSALAPERTAIAVHAIMLSMHAMEREVLTPTWPSSDDFSVITPRDDYPTSSGYLPPSLLSKPGMQDIYERCSSVLAAVSTFCNIAIGHMSFLDDQWQSRLTPAFEDSFVVRRNADGVTVAYPIHHTPHINLLQTCFQSWPRFLHSSIPVGDAVDMLLRGVIHVEPSLCDTANTALRRFMANPVHSIIVVSKFTAFLFGPSRGSQDVSGIKLLVEFSRLLNLWVDIVDGWIRDVIQTEPDEDIRTISARCTEIEAAALFLLAHESEPVHLAGVGVMRNLTLLGFHISQTFSAENPLYIAQRLHKMNSDDTYLSGYDELLDVPELARLAQWRQSKRDDLLLRIADSSNERDRKLWRYVFPAFMQSCMEHAGPTMTSFREIIVASVSRYHPTIAHLAGLSSRMPVGLSNRILLERNGFKLVKDKMPLVDQWHLWVKILSATGTPPDSSRPAFTHLGRDHSRAHSDSFERERLSTTRGLFRYLTPFLDSEYTPFRDAAVLCISSFPPSSYPQLLEDLSLLAGRQFYDDSRSKAASSPALEQNSGLLGSRQLHDESKMKISGPVLHVERSRRQERLHSAVARIYYLTAPFLQHQRSSAALANVLKFVRNTQAFLSAPETRESQTLQRLRRYFCGIVERLFDGLALLKDSDRFFTPNMHLALYRLCEEWCQLGPQSEAIKRRLAIMQRKAASSELPAEGSDPLEYFRNETLTLSHASIGALASLCHKALYPPELFATSPIDRSLPEIPKPLSPSSVLERLSAILSSSHAPSQERGKKALRSILTSQVPDSALGRKNSLIRALVVTENVDTSNTRFFEVISDIVCKDAHGFTFSQIVCLGLSNLCHASVTIRNRAFNMLEAIHQQFSGLLTMSTFEATIASLASSSYIHGHRLISDFLAGEHPHQASSMLMQIADWLSQLPEEASDTNVALLLLQSLEYWISNISLMTDDKAGLSRDGLSCLYHLMALTLRHGQTHSEQILVIWTKLVDSPQQSNGHATIRFLLEQSHKVGRPIFIGCAANIVACLCQTSIGRQIFEDLCSVIEPARMLPTIDHKLTFPKSEDMELWADLDALFAAEPRLVLGSAQFAWLFLADVAIQRYWELKPQLPVLLHALFTHLDHRISFVRHRSRTMLFQLLRSWTPGYDELSDRSLNPGRAAMKEAISHLESLAQEEFWTEEDTGPEAEPKMKWLSSRVITYLEPLAPSLANQWGSLALTWGTACSIRSTAFRSLQIFRALMPRVKQNDFALLLGRLSNTISASDENIQSFTSEIILTITAVATSSDVDPSLLPQIFWCAFACLSTSVESEFSQTLILLESLLTRIDLDDHRIVELLLSQKPTGWQGFSYLQPTLLKGLRSSTTSGNTIRILHALAKVQDHRLIDIPDNRIRDLYTMSLPWCLHAMEQQDNSLVAFAESLAKLAQQEGKHSINKIMISFAKSHFRTKDDFLRQSVASLREHYGAHHWTEIVTLLLGLVLNTERWLRIQAMQILKVLFQQRETRNPVELLGSELLMPLLRLLETDLASYALDVLEEPMTMSGGLAAKHVLRMSMHAPTLPRPVDDESITTVFGVPEESGWCVAQEDLARETCRENVMAVFDTCQGSAPSRPSRIDFEPEVEALASIVTPTEQDLGGLVKNLHELTGFFQEEPLTVNSPLPLPTRRLQARVAAILAKSTAAESFTDSPQTPFLDVFRVGGGNLSDDSDGESSDSDSDTDAFIFDTLATRYDAPNGVR